MLELQLDRLLKICRQKSPVLVVAGKEGHILRRLVRIETDCLVYNVIQLVDSNPARQGLSFQVGDRMLQIEDPSCVENREAIIFILSTAYKISIERSIRSYGYQNETVAL